jgi:hypothetical protein
MTENSGWCATGRYGVTTCADSIRSGFEPTSRRNYRFPDVVITGIGVLAPRGVDNKAFWKLLVEGRAATKLISFFDPSPFLSQVAAGPGGAG